MRKLAETLREYNHSVFDFTDPNNRKMYETPPEMFPEGV